MTRLTGPGGWSLSGAGGFTPLRQGVTQWFFCGCECGRHVERHPGGVSLSARVCVSGTLRSSLQPLFFLPPGGQQPPSGATYPIPTVTRRWNEPPPPTRLRSPTEVMFNHIMLTWITNWGIIPSSLWKMERRASASRLLGTQDPWTRAGPNHTGHRGSLPGAEEEEKPPGW